MKTSTLLHKSLRPSLLVVCLALGAASLRAQSIDVNFYSGGYGGSTASGAAVVGGASDTWNGIDGDPGLGGPISLVDINGNPTSATLSYDTYNPTQIGAIIPVNPNIQPNPSLMFDYLFNNIGGDITVTLQGLAANSPFDVYVYVASNDAYDSRRAATVTANSVSATATGDPQTSFIEGENYVLLQTTSSPSGTINITEAEAGGANLQGEVDMNGLQIVGAPDQPATLSLFGISGIGLILFARRTFKKSSAVLTKG